MTFYRVKRYLINKYSKTLIFDVTCVTLEDSIDEFNLFIQSCKQEKNLDNNKKFEVVIFRYDDDKNDYEEKIKECEF